MAESPWVAIASERAALAADLANLTDAQWHTPSLCEAWDVHQALAHMISLTQITPLTFLPKLAGAGFSMEKMAAKDVARNSADGPAATLAAFRAVESSRKSPPGPVDSWLGEALIHSEDIRRPLGIKHEYPLPAVTRTLEFYKNSNLIVGAKKRIAGLSLRATDVEWSHGEGPLVEGPAMSLLMAMVGRQVVLDDLTGDGVELLRAR